MYIRFEVNDQIVELYPPSDDEELINNLTDNNTYTTDYIRLLKETNRISIKGSIRRIVRVISETEWEIVYSTEPPEVVDDQPSVPCEIENADNITPNASSGSYNTRKSDEWDDTQTRFILDQFHNYLSQIGPMRRFKTKKIMWEQISNDLFNEKNERKTAVQIENRYKTVVRRKKAAIVNNSKSGHSRQTVPFEAELTKISKIDDSIEPEIIQNSRSIKVFKTSSTPDTDSDETDEPNKFPITRKKIRKTETITQTLQRIHKEKESAKQVRHQEKLQLLRELFGDTHRSE